MLIKLKAILNSLTDEELNELGFYCNDEEVIKIIVEKYCINLIVEK